MLLDRAGGEVQDGAPGPVGVSFDQGSVAPQRTGGGLASGEGPLVDDGVQAERRRAVEDGRQPAVALFQALGACALRGEVDVRGARSHAV